MRWRQEELEYLTNLAQEPPEDLAKVTYVEALETLKSARYVYVICYQTPPDCTPSAGWTAVSAVTFVNASNPDNFNDTAHIKSNQAFVQAKIAERNGALRKLQHAEEAAIDMERRLGITARWTDDSPEYKEAFAYVQNRRFIRAVEELERLVIQRLFELSKANLAGTGTSSLS